MKKTKSCAFQVGMEVVVVSGSWHSAKRLARVEKITPSGQIQVSGEQNRFQAIAGRAEAEERTTLPSGRAGWGSSRGSIRPATDAEREEIERASLVNRIASARGDVLIKLPLEQLRQIASWLKAVRT